MRDISLTARELRDPSLRAPTCITREVSASRRTVLAILQRLLWLADERPRPAAHGVRSGFAVIERVWRATQRQPVT